MVGKRSAWQPYAQKTRILMIRQTMTFQVTTGFFFRPFCFNARLMRIAHRALLNDVHSSVGNSSTTPSPTYTRLCPLHRFLCWRSDFSSFLVAKSQPSLKEFLPLHCGKTSVCAGSAFIDNFHVRPDCKRRGIGRALMRFSAAEMIRRGYTGAHLSVLEANVRLLAFFPTFFNFCRTFVAPCLTQLLLAEVVALGCFASTRGFPSRINCFLFSFFIVDIYYETEFFFV